MTDKEPEDQTEGETQEESVSVREMIQLALEKIFEGRYVVTSWTCTVEVIGAEEGKGLIQISAQETAPWLEAGMLLSSLDDVRAKMGSTTETFEEEDEEDG